MSKARNLRQWRQAQLVPDGRGGTRSMTQKELAAKVGIGNSLISRIEKGERWPSDNVWTRLWAGVFGAQYGEGVIAYETVRAAQLRTWRAYSPDRKGRRP